MVKLHKKSIIILTETTGPYINNMSKSVLQRVRENVPPFSREELEVETALKRYLRRCDIALEGSKADQEPAFVNSLIVRLY